MTLRSIITKTGRYVFTQRHTRTKLTRAEQLNSRMSQEMNENKNKVYKVVLSGGPCGGKTTGQARLSTFFENLGWKVYRAQETALVLMSGGVKFSELSKNDAYKFQENLIKTMIQIENTYMDLACTCKKNCLIICDRGVMDGSAYLPTEDWEKMKKDNDWNEVNLRDNRYDQIIHMVTAANGAEAFYTCAGHKTRTEGIEEAVALDKITAQAWVGHPYFDVIDNSTDFEEKIMRMVGSVCNRLGIDAGDRLHSASKKRKFLVSCLPDNEKFPTYQDFTVVHDYLVTPSRKMQARLRKRGQNGVWTYTHTIRRPEINNQSVEVKMPINFKDYQILLVQKDDNNATIYKQRRCFLWGDRHYQMDIYTDQCPEKCAGLVLLETYTTSSGQLVLPDFLNIKKEVTSDPEYSMFNLSRKDTLSKNSPVKGGGRPNGNTQGLINDGLPQTNGNGIVGH